MDSAGREYFCATRESNKKENEYSSKDGRKMTWLKHCFTQFTSYESDNFSSFQRFIVWMHRPTDAAALGIFRMLFGLCMLLDIPEERGGGNLDIRFGEPKHCHFPLFGFISPLSVPYTGIVYLVMWLGAFGIMLGYKFKSSCLLFLCPYVYIFLLDKAAWNNHSYLFGLTAFLLFFTDAHRFCSADYKNLLQSDQMVPYWNYFLIKFQFFILYFVAGLKKLTFEWLSGYTMTNLGYHWVFSPFRLFLSVEMVELLIIHWFTAIFDLTIAFWLTYEKTRLPATPFVISFHLMNSRLFRIGMFPWVCLAELPLFFSVDWPRKLRDRLRIILSPHHITADKTVGSPTKTPSKISTEIKDENLQQRQVSFKEQLRISLILLYCALQLFLPYSHFITKGYNNWTNGAYGYSWDMMVHAYDTLSASVKIVDNNNGQAHYLEPYAFTEYDRWTKHADMAKQYAKCIERNLIQDFENNPKTVLTSTNISIYFDIWCSMNGRFQQRVFDPRVDILKAEWSPFEETKWGVPLLKELNYMRPILSAITQDVLSWSNHSDCLFIADYPEMILDNFISDDLTNVTLTVLQGAVQYETVDKETESNCPISVGPAQRVTIEVGKLHRITTVSKTPSCYMYSFVNQTMADLGIILTSLPNKPMLPIWDEISNRIENYKYFFYHVGNSILFLVYGVPMPLRIREHT